MKRIFLLLNILLVLTNYELIGQDKRFLTFYATREGAVGHAFVSYVREDPILQMTVFDGCWGFYPKNKYAGGASFAIGSVEGEIRNDFLTQSEIGLTVEVTKSEYDKALSIKEKWESAKYELTVNDCISFVTEVAQSLSGKLNLPQRDKFDLPHSFIEELIVLNKPIEPGKICFAHSDIVDEYDKSKSTYHFYSLSWEICDSKDNPCCSEQFVFDIMKSRAEFTAPYAGGNPVYDCEQYEVIGLGSIVTKLGDKPLSITNYTKKNHLLHEGKVIRYVVKVGTKINVYTVGIGNNKNAFLAWLNEKSLSVNIVWGGVNKKLKEEVEKQLEEKKKNKECGDPVSTLFLFDLSGSMNDFGGGTKPKVEQAKDASKTTISSLRSSSQGVINQVAVYGFSGGCVPDPTVEVSPFTTDLDAVESRINSMYAGGGTPLDLAISAAKCKMAAHLQKEGQDKGKIILLSDGQGTCGVIRPPGVYNSAPLQQRAPIYVNADECGLPGGQPVALSYYTVGFDIPPGSPAERDLQYLSQISGGKYLNVQNQTQLVRAFRKFNRVYQPKEYPALPNLPSTSTGNFDKGVGQIKEEYFDEALTVYTAFAKQHPDDCHGAYNLALTQEANDFYREAIDNYRLYLRLCPTPPDRDFVEKQIAFLEEEFREFVLFQKEVVRSDLEFLHLHFQRIQNGQSVALAEEFKGFLQEKDNYYEYLPRLIASKNRDLITLSEDIASAFQQCATLIRRNPQHWDRDAVPLISMAYLNLEELLGEM